MPKDDYPYTSEVDTTVGVSLKNLERATKILTSLNVIVYRSDFPTIDKLLSLVHEDLQKTLKTITECREMVAHAAKVQNENGGE